MCPVVGCAPWSPVEGNVFHCQTRISDLYRGRSDDLSSWIVPFREMPEMEKSTWSAGVNGPGAKKTEKTLPQRDGKRRGGKGMPG